MFRIHHRVGTSVEPHEYLPVTANETVTAGEALVLSSGKLTKCGATTKPTFIAMGGKNADGNAPVIRVTPTVIFAVPAYADQSALSIGAAVTLHTDGKQVTATTSSGVFTLDTVAGAGAECTGHFE